VWTLVLFIEDFTIISLDNPARSIPVALGACAFMGATIGAYDSARTPDGERPLTKEEKRMRFFKTPPKPLVDVAE